MPRPELRKTIGRKTLFFLTINAIIGTGIFFLPAVGAAYAGPASLVSWLLMSIIAIFISFYFAELASMFPKSGGVYEYTKHAFGEFPSFVFGWTAWIVANITIAMLVIGSLRYVFPEAGAAFNVVFSLFFVVLFNVISYRGIGVSSKLLLFFGVMTFVSLLAVIIPGAFFANTANLQPFYVFPASSIILAIYFISESFFGWESIGYLSEEVKDTQKVMPKMLVLTTAVIAALSMALVFIALTVVKWSAFAAQPAPLSFLVESMFGRDFAAVFSFVVFIPLIGTAASWIVSSPRLLYAMARDKVMPPSFASVHGRHRSPHKAIIFQTIVTSIITVVALGNFMLALSMLVPLVIFMYSGVMLSVTVLRGKKTKIKRHFKAPLPRAGPVVLTLFMAYLLYLWLNEVTNAAAVLLMSVMLVFIGLPLYIMIKLQTDEKFTAKFFDSISSLWDRAFPLWYRRHDIEKVVGRLRLKKNSYVLDFGCGSGVTTSAIADIATSGMVVGVDISERQLDHAGRRLMKKGRTNVVLVDEKKMKFRKNSFDAISAVGVLEYLENPRKTVRNLMSFLKKGGRFSFLAFGSSLGTPAPIHLKNEAAIRKLFAGTRAEIHVEKEKKNLTEYWYVWGAKK